MVDAVALSQALIRQRSVIDERDGGAITLLEKELKKLGFTCHRIEVKSASGVTVPNLYARRGTSGKNLCFAGHTDVVPVGDEKAWSVDPFAGTIKSGNLIGRGASDMKAAIAAMVAASATYKGKGSISFLIAGDEEGGSKGTPAVLEWLKKKGEKLDACIVGEPTNPTKLGQMVKIGRRGSMSFAITVKGKQGHVAYPDAADNPITTLVKILHALKGEPLDNGTEFFPASNLEIVRMDVQNKALNVIPAQARADVNIRFNPTYTREKLEKWIKKRCSSVTKNYTLEKLEKGSEAFLTEPGELSDIVQAAVKKVVGKKPVLGTTGGTSDARFIKNACQVVECGLINATAHQVDEQVAVAEIEAITKIYEEILKGYFKD